MKKTHIHFLFIILAGILTISSCKIGEKYTRPNLDIPEHYRAVDSGYNVDSSFATINWREFFGDPILINLIDYALQNNYDMRTALLNIDIANRNLRRNKLDYLPTVGSEIATVNQQWRSKDFYANPSSGWYGDGTRGEAPDHLFMYQSLYGSRLDFNWEIDIWGKIANQRDQLTAEFLNSIETKHAIQTQLISDIAKGYYNLQMLDAQVEVAKRNLVLNDSTLRMIRLQYEAGEITALAIQQTESQRLIAASLIPELEKSIALQENALRVLTGQMPEDIFRSSTIDSTSFASRGFSLGTPIEIVRNRPDIRFAENELIGANAEMNISQIMRYPQLSLGGVLGVNAMLPSNWFNIPGALLGGITGGLTAPIFQNGKLKNRYEVAKLEREKAELSLQRSVMEAINEVSDAIITIEKQQEQLNLAKRRVENSMLAVRNASLLFQSDYATYLEVITAQSNALNSELNLAGLQQLQLNAYVDLYRALGGGWQEE